MLRKLLLALCALVVLCGIAVVAAGLVVTRASQGRLYSDASLIPHRRVGLVLGCPKRIPGGWPNPFFENRITAAAELYHRRKIDFLVVSGDNHVHGYDEPTDMKDALVEKGVPPERIYLDYAGFRTLDSVVRAKSIFGQDKVTIVSQKFHNQRAIFLASHHAIDAIGFDAPDVALQYALKTLVREQFARVKAVLDVYLIHKQPHFLGQKIIVGYPRTVLGTQDAPEFAQLMCRQLPNVRTIVSYHEFAPPGTLVPQPDANDPANSLDDDDTYDALVRLSTYALPCLVDRLTDTRWMPAPRTEPLLGAPVVGDVAYMILGDIGVPDLLPGLAGKKPNELRMDDYFIWPTVGDHRRRLQNAVKAWLREHPDCCGTAPIALKAAPPHPRIRLAEDELARWRAQFARLRPGMTRGEVLSTVGQPDAMESESNDHAQEAARPYWQAPGLLGSTSPDHNEVQAAIYFVERWADEIARRDPLRDRYVILYFSADGKFTRMFSNVAGIPPLFPSTQASWQKLIWGDDTAKP